MKTIRITLPRDMKTAEIIPLADLHIGDAMSDWEHIQKQLDYIKRTPNCYCILGGDLMDTAIASSIGDTYGANLQPMKQLEFCTKLFADIAPKTLCVLHGNHENRVYKSDGIDMTRIMCDQLGIGEKYTETTALLFVELGNDAHVHNRQICYTIYATHGSGGGRKEGGKINRLVDLSNIVDADIYICAHTHLPALLKTGFYRPCLSNRSVAYCEKLFVNTASSLNYGGYGDVQGFRPNSKEYPIIVLDGVKKRMKAVL